MAEEILKKFITQLVIDNKGYNLGLKDSEGKMINLTRIGKTMALGIGAIGTTMTAVAGAAAEITRETVKVGDKFDKLSQRIGISVEKLSAYNHVAELSGTSLDAMANGVGRLSRNMLDASQGVGEAKDSFDRLNISVIDSKGNLKDSDDILIEIADKFSKMPDGAEKTALSMEMLGRSGKDLIPMFNQGADGMKKMLDEGQRLRGWTTEQAKEAALLHDNMTRVTTTFKGLKDKIGMNLIPLFQAMVQLTSDLYVENRNLIEGGIGKLPDVIKFNLIPALTTGASALNIISTGFSIAYNSGALFVEGLLFLKTDINNLFAQIFNSVLGYTSLAGVFTKAFKDETSVNLDKITERIKVQKAALADTLDQYKKNKEEIDGLQRDLVIGFDTSYNRMISKKIEFDSLFDVELTEFQAEEYFRQQKELSEKIIEEQKKRAEEQKKINDQMVEDQKKQKEKTIETEQEITDRLFELENDKYDTMRYRLEQEYDEKRKNVQDKKALDEWYHAEWKKIRDTEEDELAASAQRKADEDKKVYDEKYKYLFRAQDDWIRRVSEGASLEESITKASGKAVQGILADYTRDKVKKLTEAAIQIITGHVAEGASSAGASGLTVWDSLGNIAIYMAKIGASIAASRAIANKINFAGGGWLADHPKGGVINQGSSGGRADDVLLGSGGGANFFGSRGESVFIMNANATKKFGPMLAAMNISTGFADGGFMAAISKAVSPTKSFNSGMGKEEQVAAAAHNLVLGATKNTLAGWALAGDWLQGIPFGAKDGGINVGVGIPAMFAGKMAGNRAAKKALGFGLGGFIKKLADPFGLVSTIKAIPSFFNDPIGTLTKVLQDQLMRSIGFEDIMYWMMTAMKHMPGVTNVAHSLIGPGTSMPKVGMKDFIGSNMTIGNLVKDFLPKFDNGGVITQNGLEPFPSGHVAFAGVGQPGEVLSPVGGGGGITINFALYGIDRANARSAVKDYIIPELNFYMRSRGQRGI